MQEIDYVLEKIAGATAKPNLRPTDRKNHRNRK